MKMLKLIAENVKRLKAVTVEPREKGLTVVAGKNAAGKTSVLDCIMIALGGERVIPSKPVRRGEDQATVELDLGEYIVRRTMTADGGGQLVVRDKDLKRQQSPQAILDGLFGPLSFDPLAFVKQKPAERTATLSQLLGLDFSKEDDEIAAIYQERTIVNREGKTLQAQLDGLPEYPDAPKEEIDQRAISDEQMRAFEVNKKNAEQRRQAEAAERVADADRKTSSNLATDVDRLRKQLMDAEADLAEAKKMADQSSRTAERLGEEVKKLVDVDLAPFAKRISEANDINRKVRTNVARAQVREKWKVKNKESEDLSKKITDLERQKRRRVTETKFPVEGLSLSDTKEVEFNGIPFEQVNTADQLRISVAISAAMNPKLRLILVRQGNDLDDDNLALLDQLAVDNDMQVILERVSPTGESCVIIEDGMVKQPEQKQLV